MAGPDAGEEDALPLNDLLTDSTADLLRCGYRPVVLGKLPRLGPRSLDFVTMSSARRLLLCVWTFELFLKSMPQSLTWS